MESSNISPASGVVWLSTELMEIVCIVSKAMMSTKVTLKRDLVQK